MSQIDEQSRATGQPASTNPADRRRPGRPETVNPALIPLLRRDSLLSSLMAQRETDDLAAARGIGLGVLIGVACWIAVGLLTWWLLVG